MIYKDILKFCPIKYRKVVTREALDDLPEEIHFLFSISLFIVFVCSFALLLFFSKSGRRCCHGAVDGSSAESERK